MKDLKRKAIILLMCLIVLAMLLMRTPSGLPQRVKIPDGTYSFFYDNTTSCSLRCTPNGAGTIVDCGFESLSKVPAGYRGASVTFEGGEEDVETWLKKLSVRVGTREKVENIICVYGFSPDLRGGLTIDGRTVNVQIAFNSGRVSIGTPVLLGSY